jgi:hypothetical protein
VFSTSFKNSGYHFLTSDNNGFFSTRRLVVPEFVVSSFGVYAHSHIAGYTHSLLHSRLGKTLLLCTIHLLSLDKSL